ncbi:hypothetical protein C8R46DRAFT_1301432 [Mycena filopes]|nr:hypothetical protein C8R46DRAFT_1301432 [Mycena filopes]
MSLAAGLRRTAGRSQWRNQIPKFASVSLLSTSSSFLPPSRDSRRSKSSSIQTRSGSIHPQPSFYPNTILPTPMRRRYMPSARLNRRLPMPQSNLGPGESSPVQNEPVEVAPQNDLPQKVATIQNALTFATVAATSTPSAAIDTSSPPLLTSSTTTAALASSSSVSSAVLSASTDSSSSAPATSSNSPGTSSVAPSSSSPSPSSVSSLASSTSSASASSSYSPSSSTVAASASPSASSAAAVPPQTMTHGAPFFAALVLGGLILVAFLAAIIACLFRIRTRRREARAALSAIEWDPVVLADEKGPAPIPPDAFAFSFTGDRDVGEPRRSNSPPFDPYHQHQPNALAPYHPPPFDAYPSPFADPSPYYAPHHTLADSAAYPLPPVPRGSGSGGPYPTARPLPAHLADRDPHRVSFSASTRSRSTGSGRNRSAASSRTGSVSSRLPSASTLCVANGAASRASTALGVHEEEEQDGWEGGSRANAHAARFGGEGGTPSGPPFVALGGDGNGRGLEVPWRRASGWAPLPAPPSDAPAQGEGWTEAIRASVMSALNAVTGAGTTTPTSDDEARVDGGDGLTLGHAPSTRRARREEGWRRFQDAQREMDLDLERAESVSTVGDGACGGYYLAPPQLARGLQPSMASDLTTTTAQSVRTENSRVPLVTRPRPAVVSRASSASVYSTDGYGYGKRGG